MFVQERLGLATCAVLAVFGLTFGMSGYPLLDPDEGRNAEVAREMAVTNDYVLPSLNGLPYLDKPVLYFAAGAIAMEVMGPTVAAARMPSLLFTLATLVLIYRFGTRLYDRRAGVTAAIATAATPFALAYSRTVIFDSALTFFVVASLVSFFEAIEAELADRPTAAWWRSAAWGAIALGVLTKGPIALALPLMIAVPFGLWTKRARALVDGVAVLFFLALLLPWVFAVSREVPGFLHYVLVTETALRLATDQLGRTEPIWYFAAILPAAALPWSIVVAGGARELKARLSITPRDRRIVFLILWVAVPLVFFSLSQSKRPQYVLPLIPGIGLLVAALWHRAAGPLAGVRSAAAALAAAGLLFLSVRHRIAGWIDTTDSVAAAIPATALGLGTACLLGALVAWFGTRQRTLALLGLLIPVTSIPLVSGGLMHEIGADRSAERIAAAIDRIGGSRIQVVAVGTFPLSLPFYLRRPILLSTDDGAELTSNFLIRHFDDWRGAATLRPSAWWQEALVECSRPRVFVVRADDLTTRNRLGDHLALIVETRKHAVYGPCGLSDLALGP